MSKHFLFQRREVPFSSLESVYADKSHALESWIVFADLNGIYHSPAFKL